MKDLVIIGASGFAKEVMWLAEDYNRTHHCWNILGFINNEPSEEVMGYPVVGDDDWLINRNTETDVLLGIGNVIVKKKLYEKYKENPYLTFPTIISNNAIVSDHVKFGIGCIVCAGTIITVDVTIGNFVTLNLGCTVGHDVVMDDFIQVNPCTNISGNVHISDCCDIGTGVQIIQGKTLGYNCTIGAGAVVVKDIEENCTAVGIPAKPIKQKGE